MNKPVAFIVVENGQTWLRTTAETEEAIRTGFITETIPLYKQREPLNEVNMDKIIKHIKQDADFSGVMPWQICYIAHLIEQQHGITGVDDE